MIIEQHERFQNEVAEYLKSLGFIIPSPIVYHEAFDNEVIEILRNRYDLTSLYIRGRADRLAILPDYEITFEWEAKSRNTRKYSGMLAEVLPFLHHKLKSSLGVQCLYVFRNFATGTNHGFWIKNHPEIDRIHIPERWSRNNKIEMFQNIFQVHFPEIPIKIGGRVYGSNDPFLVMDTINKYPHWQDLIKEIIHDSERTESL